MYKLKYFDNPESHAHGIVVGVVDDNEREVGKFFDKQDDAFDYIKIELEHDAIYKDFIFNPDIYIREIYDTLSNYDKVMIQKQLVNRYRDQCMSEYFYK